MNISFRYGLILARDIHYSNFSGKKWLIHLHNQLKSKKDFEIEESINKIDNLTTTFKYALKSSQNLQKQLRLASKNEVYFVTKEEIYVY